MRILEILRQDATIAARMLRRSSGFALAAVATLAVGIGATTAIFSLINVTLLEPLPYPDADRIVQFWFTTPEGSGLTLSIPEFNLLAQQIERFRGRRRVRLWRAGRQHHRRGRAGTGESDSCVAGLLPVIRRSCRRRPHFYRRRGPAERRAGCRPEPPVVDASVPYDRRGSLAGRSRWAMSRTLWRVFLRLIFVPDPPAESGSRCRPIRTVPGRRITFGPPRVCERDTARPGECPPQGDSGGVSPQVPTRQSKGRFSGEAAAGDHRARCAQRLCWFWLGP